MENSLKTYISQSLQDHDCLIQFPQRVGNHAHIAGIVGNLMTFVMREES